MRSVTHPSWQRLYLAVVWLAALWVVVALFSQPAQHAGAVGANPPSTNYDALSRARLEIPPRAAFKSELGVLSHDSQRILDSRPVLVTRSSVT